jgi:glycosyltransferase involved in cell wall biosynthesis
MFHNKRIVVVMPAYNVAKTLEITFRDLKHDILDEVILVDDASHDNTADLARKLGITTVVHERNKGYGGNQKTCYKTALEHGADVVIMVHPDYQYDPRLVVALTAMIVDGPYDAVIGSRILGGHALKGGMPLYKYIANRFLTFFENLLLGEKLSEYHTGYRAFSREVLESIAMERNSDDFIFDNQMLAQIFMKGFLVGEVSVPTKYFPEASSINFRRSVRYGLGVLAVSIGYRMHKMGLRKNPLYT